METRVAVFEEIIRFSSVPPKIGARAINLIAEGASAGEVIEAVKLISHGFSLLDSIENRLNKKKKAEAPRELDRIKQELDDTEKSETEEPTLGGPGNCGAPEPIQIPKLVRKPQ